VFGFIFRESSCGPGVRANFAAQNMHSKKLDFVDRREQIVAITHLKRFLKAVVNPGFRRRNLP